MYRILQHNQNQYIMSLKTQKEKFEISLCKNDVYDAYFMYCSLSLNCPSLEDLNIFKNCDSIVTLIALKEKYKILSNESIEKIAVDLINKEKIPHTIKNKDGEEYSISGLIISAIKEHVS